MSGLGSVWVDGRLVAAVVELRIWGLDRWTHNSA